MNRLANISLRVNSTTTTAAMSLFFTVAFSMPLALISATATTGCGAKETTDFAPTTHEVSAASSAEAEGAATTASVDAVLADVDLGRDLSGAKTRLEALAALPTISVADRTRAKLALSVIAEKTGDRERAVALVEELIESGTSEGAEDRLRLLLTGKEARQGASLRQQELTISPFARALTKFYPTEGQSQLHLDTVLFGGGDITSARLGTFIVDEALREREDARCPSCEKTTSIQAMTSRVDGWTQIPRYAKKLDTMLAVFYVDLESLIPSRYESYLPMPTAEIATRLAHGEGVIAVGTRKDAPPVVLIGAPRRAQLADVEEKLAAMSEIPSAPVAVKLPSALKPKEIQGVMHQNFGRMRSCYEATKRATGKVTYRFAIQANGSVKDVQLSIDPALEAPGFSACMTDAINAMTFPAAAPQSGSMGTTTVVYPILFSPDGE